MQRFKKPHWKSHHSFDVRDSGNFEARLRKMIAAQDGSEEERERRRRKTARKQSEKRETDRVQSQIQKTGTVKEFKEKNQRLRQAMEAGGYRHQPKKRNNYAKMLKELRAAAEEDKKRAMMYKLNFEEIKRRLTMIGRRKAENRKREADSKQIQKKREEEKESAPVPSSSRANPVLSARQRLKMRLTEDIQVFHNLGKTHTEEKQSSSGSSASDISLLDAQLNEMLGFGPVETGRKKAEERKREEDSEQIRKKKNREDERECAPVPSTSKAGPELSARQKLKMRLTEDIQVFHSLGKIHTKEKQSSSVSSASDISLLEAQLNEMLGFGPVETGRKKAEERKREEDSEQIQKKREDERECAPVPSTSRASPVLTGRPGGPGELLISRSSVSDISLLAAQRNELTITQRLIMTKTAEDVLLYHSYCKKTTGASPAGPTRRKPKYRWRA